MKNKNLNKTRKSSKNNKNLNRGFTRCLAVCHVKASLNNTIITVTTIKGETLFWSSPGCAGFKKSKRSLSYAIHMMAILVAKKIIEKTLIPFEVHFEGPFYVLKEILRVFRKQRLIVAKVKYKRSRSFGS